MTDNDTRGKSNCPTESGTADRASGRDSNDSRTSDDSRTSIGSGGSTWSDARQAEESFSAAMTDGGTLQSAQDTAALYDPRDSDLTKFQLRVLAILDEESRYGLAIKRSLEAYYGKDVNHGRLYPNLDELVEKGYVKKGEIDKRTNSYELTDAGRDVLVAELEWIVARMGIPSSVHRLGPQQPRQQEDDDD